MRYKCLLETLNFENNALNLFPFVECHVEKNMIVGTSAQEVATKVFVLHAKLMLIKYAFAESKLGKFNVGKLKNKNLNVKQCAKRKGAVANIYAIKFAVNLELLRYHKTTLANLPAIS
jgi:hypothetical protein